MTFKACLGGFCKLRSQCEHHENPDNRESDDDPAERLCDRGQEKEMFFKRIGKDEKNEYDLDTGMAIRWERRNVR